MEKTPGTRQAGSRKTEPASAQDKKKRLADALRRNLAKRKDKKETGPGRKPDAE